MKKTSLLFFLCLISILSTAQQALWVSPINGDVMDPTNVVTDGPHALDIKSDHSGNVYVVGIYRQNLQIGMLNLPGGPNFSRTFLAKFNAAGVPEFLIDLGGPLPNGGNTWLDTDQAGNIYVASIFQGSLTLGNITLTTSSPNDRNGFVASYSGNGTINWAVATSGTLTRFTDFNIDAQDNLIVQGAYNNGNVFGTALSGTGNFIAKLNNSGVLQWVNSGALQRIGNIDTDPAGNIYTYFAVNTGHPSNPRPFNMCNVSLPGGTQMRRTALVKYDPAGSCTWIKMISKEISTDAPLAVDDAGNIYIADIFLHDSIDFGSIVLVNDHSGASNQGYFLAKYNSSGQDLWAQDIGERVDVAFPTHVKLKLDGVGNPFVSAPFYDGFSGDSTSIGPFRFPSLSNTLTKFTPNGALVWVQTIDRSLHQTVWLRNFNIDPAGNIAGMIVTQNLQSTGALYPINVNIGGIQAIQNTYGSIIFKMLSEPANITTGKIFVDTNSNGTPDTGEPGYPEAFLEAQPGGHMALSNSQGIYTLYSPAGSFTVSPASHPYYTVTPATRSVSFTASGQISSGQDFALQPIANQQDLRIVATAGNLARPGFAFPITITYRNMGTTVMSGTVEAQLDAQLLFQSSTPAFSSQTGNTLSWSFSNLQPLETRSIEVMIQVPATIPLGLSLSNNFTVHPLAGDLTPVNNAAVLLNGVFGSYDPNDKQVTDTILTPADVAAGKYLGYTIRFQNTGTDTAFTVRLLDTLDTQLQIASLEVLSSSHNYTMQLRNNNLLEFTFNNILLPDSNVNEPASHGFIRYRIRPKTNLVIGNIIHNTAAIYFDFNDPVITNTTATEVSLLNGTFTALEQKISVFPNPNNGSFTLAMQNLQEPSVKAELRNVLGQIVWQQVLAVEDKKLQQAIHTQNLSKGIYQLLVYTAKGSVVQKVVVE